MANKAQTNGWYIWSSHGVVIFYIATNPDCTIPQIAEALCLTQRTIWGVVGDLRRADMLEVRREGRRHHYSVNMDAAFRHPTIEGATLRDLLGGIPQVNGNGLAKKRELELVGSAT